MAIATATFACSGTNAGAPAPEGEALPTNGEWRSLFDGETLNGWRSFQGDEIQGGWAVVDGNLTRVGSGGDIITEDQFGNFELELEWNVSPGGNSGIFFRATVEADRIYHSAPEMQVLDDDEHPDGASLLTSAGADYGLHAVPEHLAKPPSEWNAVRIVIDGAHVEYWLNGEKAVRRVARVRPSHARPYRAAGSRRLGGVPQHQDQRVAVSGAAVSGAAGQRGGGAVTPPLPSALRTPYSARSTHNAQRTTHT